MSTTTFLLERMQTPLGQMLLVSDEQQILRALDWWDYEVRMRELMRQQYKGTHIELRETQLSSPAALAMRAYFEGDLAAPDTLHIDTGGTVFQREVWHALRTVPAGQTLSYLELATRIGRPKAVRAVGLANGANPISIVLPCHRIIGSNRNLTGYGGGLFRKRWLLEHEKAAGFETASLPGFQGPLP
ncbi:methylated-DNA--[protein]-cysteine S-methyltransferase [Pusillimonas sp. CC-YST705]|uniref:Methylated-DNA--protein-cysteine methyltransferase n=1 Tax=Mesopusillimonas faecipullorum TaxID=2755040 RepID=A0ABS8CFG4_9BURK|nr:methylated-DNA--[protein]-cysteine S-methyltransferase [Mesopusillimonas faecipullorum]MCB5364790.1 methylated-DNA--[protein]-cysteine S-methyltransferase [Mesopusillimonas faecipullorum]